MPVDAPAAPARVTDARRALVSAALFIAATAAIFVYAAIAGITEGGIIPWLAAGATAAGVGFLQWTRPAVPIDLRDTSRAFLAVSTVAAVLALVFVVRLTVFMVDPARTSYSTMPFE